MATPKLEKIFRDIVMKRIEEGTLAPPAMPGIALRAHKYLRNPDQPLTGIVQLIETDTLLVAEILRLANTALYGSKQIPNIEQAVIRLGEKKLQNVLIEISARRLFESKSQKIAAEFRGIWEHSVAVAMIARDVSALSGFPESDSAYMAGLLHDVGKPIIGNMLMQAEDAISKKSKDRWMDAKMWLKVVHGVHRQVGASLAENWNLPEAVAAGITDITEYDPVNRQSIPNFVRFGNALAKQEGIYTGFTDKEDSNTLVLVGRSLLGIDDDEMIARLTEGLSQRVKIHIKS